MKILDGKKLANKIILEIKKKVAIMKKRPVLAMVLVGDDPASKIYVSRKKISCEKAGIGSQVIMLPEKTSEKEILSIVGNLNRNKNITAIMVQLPLPKHVDKKKVIEAIDPGKDADCLHPLNYGKFAQEGEGYSVVAPATPMGIIKLLDEYKIKIEGKNAVIIGRSNIVGKPVAQMLLNRNATVTICHSQTKNLKSYTQKADLLVVAAGKISLINADMIQKGVVVIDVGVNRGANKKIQGDVDFRSVSKKAAYISPVPGGVGPVTIAMLLWNTTKLAK